MTVPRTLTSGEVEGILADQQTAIIGRFRALCADPEVAERMRRPVGPLTDVSEIVTRHNRDPRAEWSPDEAATLLVFHGDLADDLETVQKLLGLPGFVGFPKLLRDDRLGEIRR